MSVKLEVTSNNGNIDLTQYLNVEKGAGMDPADPSFTNKVFAHSLLKQGGTLALEDLKLREQTFPLRLTAKSKDALTALVRELNVIVNTQAAQVSWTDEGASNPTLLYLTSGQFDVEFDYRQGEHFMVKGKLRLFSQPLAVSTTAFRELPLATGATSAATAPIVTYSTASPIQGDAIALAQGVLQHPQTPFTAAHAFSLLPSASYLAWIPAASLAAGSKWVAGASGGFSFLSGGASPGNVFLGAPEVHRAQVEPYYGDNRVLAIARRANNATAVALELFSANYSAIATVPAASSGQPWTVLDMGVLSRPSLAAFSGVPWTIGIGATASMALYGLVMLPENTTTWLFMSAEEQTSSSTILEWDGLSERVLFTSPYPVADLTGQARGAIPPVPPGSSAPVFALFSFPYTEAPTLTTAKVRVQERYRYAV